MQYFTSFTTRLQEIPPIKREQVQHRTDLTEQTEYSQIKSRTHSLNQSFNQSASYRRRRHHYHHL